MSKGKTTMIRIRRALLFMPGDDRHKIEKGAASRADSVIMDLEDGVALNRKPEARATILGALREVDFGSTERVVRINPVGSGFEDDDLAGTIAGRPDAYVLPKVESVQHVQHISALIADAEREHDWPLGGIRLLPIIETARAVAYLREIAECDPRLDALIFGAEDLAGDIGATRTADGLEVAYARGAVVIHAKAAGLDAVDTVHVDLHDIPGLTAQTEMVMRMGFTGKLAIHPRQVDPIQAVFTPTDEEIARARRIIDAHDSHQAAGTGAFALDGKMVDMPIVRAAEAVLARAKAAGKS